MRAKNASEILDDATLVCWHSFDDGSYHDSGPLRLRGTAANVTYADGKRNQAILFNSNASFYRVKTNISFRFFWSIKRSGF